jgi:hypothetical protein
MRCNWLMEINSERELLARTADGTERIALLMQPDGHLDSPWRLVHAKQGAQLSCFKLLPVSNSGIFIWRLVSDIEFSPVLFRTSGSGLRWHGQSGCALIDWASAAIELASNL